MHSASQFSLSSEVRWLLIVLLSSACASLSLYCLRSAGMQTMTETLYNRLAVPWRGLVIESTVVHLLSMRVSYIYRYMRCRMIVNPVTNRKERRGARKAASGYSERENNTAEQHSRCLLRLQLHNVNAVYYKQARQSFYLALLSSMNCLLTYSSNHRHSCLCAQSLVSW